MAAIELRHLCGVGCLVVSVAISVLVPARATEQIEIIGGRIGGGAAGAFDGMVISLGAGWNISGGLGYSIHMDPVGPIPKNNSSLSGACGQDGNPSSGNPVVIATGEKWLAQQDFESFGINALSFGRTWRSVQPANFTYMFGVGWLSSYDYARLVPSAGCDYDPDSTVCVPREVQFTDADGTQIQYMRNPLNWQQLTLPM